MFRSQFRSNVVRSHLSAGFAAAVYVLVLPATGISALFALAGQSESRPPQTRDTAINPVNAQPAPAKSVVVITGTLDLGKMTIADYGDVEPANR